MLVRPALINITSIIVINLLRIAFSNECIVILSGKKNLIHWRVNFMSWGVVQFIGVAAVWIIWHSVGAKAYLKHVKELKKNDRKN